MALTNAEKQARWRAHIKATRAKAELPRAAYADELWAKVRPLVERLEAASTAARELRLLLDPAATRRDISDLKIIAIQANPHRPGTKSHERFALYRIDMTLREWKKTAKANNRAMGFLRRDIRNGWISVG